MTLTVLSPSPAQTSPTPTVTTPSGPEMSVLGRPVVGSFRTPTKPPICAATVFVRTSTTSSAALERSAR